MPEISQKPLPDQPSAPTALIQRTVSHLNSFHSDASSDQGSRRTQVYAREPENAPPLCGLLGQYGEVSEDVAPHDRPLWMRACNCGIYSPGELFTRPVSRMRWSICVQSPMMVIIMTTATICALFMEDIRMLSAFTPTSRDEGFQVVIFICFLLFIIELFIRSFAIKDYRLSLFQLLDVVSIISLVPEIPWIWDAITESIPSLAVTGQSQQLSVARAARISQVGSRAGRILRLVRFIRLSRIAKLCEFWVRNRQQLGVEELALELTGAKTVDQSKLGQKAAPKPLVDLRYTDRVSSSQVNLEAIEHDLNSQRRDPITNAADTADASSQFVSYNRSASISNLVMSPSHLSEDEEGVSRVMYVPPKSKIEEESQVGSIYSTRVTRRVIFMILVMMFVVPQLTPNNESQSEQFGLEQLYTLASMNTTTAAQFEASIQMYKSGVFLGSNVPSNWDLLGMSVISGNFSYTKDFNLNNYRNDELRSYLCNNDEVHCAAVFSNRDVTQLEALYSIISIFIVLILLLIGGFFFSNDAHVLVLQPIERMVSIIDQLKDNPLARQAEIGMREDEEMRRQRRKQRARDAKSKQILADGGTMVDVSDSLRAMEQDDLDDEAEEGDDSNETSLLEKTLEKLTALTQIGFGESSSAIVAQYLTTDGELNMNSEGKVVRALFAIFDIPHFADICAAMQGHSTLFLNELSRTLHDEVSISGVAVLKNLGHIFVFVWKLPADLSEEHFNLVVSGKPFDLFKLPGEVQEAIKSARVVADRALAACVRAQTRILSTNQVQRFMKKLVIEPISTIKRKATRFVGTSAEVEKAAKKKNKSILLQQTLVEDEEVADAKDPSLEEPNINAPEVRLRCGMHAGWAIECAFGSKFKLDASYVSPHCTLTAKLPALCSDYDVTLLLTESVLHLLSPESAQRCRLVDRIAWQGTMKAPKVSSGGSATSSPVLKGSAAKYQTEALHLDPEEAPIIETTMFNLLCFDVNTDQLRQIRLEAPPISWETTSRREALSIGMKRADIERRKAEFSFNHERAWSSLRMRCVEWSNDVDLVAAHTDIDNQFYEFFHLGITCYLSGDWLTAREYLLECRSMHEDGPTMRALRHMKENDFIPPHGWPGCRLI